MLFPLSSPTVQAPCGVLAWQGWRGSAGEGGSFVSEVLLRTQGEGEQSNEPATTASPQHVAQPVPHSQFFTRALLQSSARRVWQCWAWLRASQQIPCCNPLDYRRKPSLHLRTSQIGPTWHRKDQEPGWPGKIPPGHLLPWWEEPWGNWGFPPVILGKDAASTGNLVQLGVNVQGNLNLLSWIFETTVLEESYVTSTRE